MALVVGVLLALFVVDGALEWAAIGTGGAVEIGEAWFWWRWTHRRAPAVGVELLIGRVVDVQDGWTHVAGERWRVSGVETGAARIVAIDGLTLLVEPA